MRMGRRLAVPPLTPPDMRVRIRRFVKTYAVPGSARSLCLELSSVLRRGWLGPLRSPHRLHRCPLPSSTPYPGQAAFRVHPTSYSKYSPSLTFGPSRPDRAGIMASADSCRLSPRLAAGVTLPGVATGLPR